MFVFQCVNWTKQKEIKDTSASALLLTYPLFVTRFLTLALVLVLICILTGIPQPRRLWFMWGIRVQLSDLW